MSFVISYPELYPEPYKEAQLCNNNDNDDDDDDDDADDDIFTITNATNEFFLFGYIWYVKINLIWYDIYI